MLNHPLQITILLYQSHTNVFISWLSVNWKSFNFGIDQLFFNEEYEEKINGKFLNWETVAKRYGKMTRYCDICTEYTPEDGQLAMGGEGKIWRLGKDKRWKPTCHNHQSTRNRRASCKTDRFRQYLCLECGPDMPVHYVKQGEGI